jgi:cell division inhibitor SulA
MPKFLIEREIASRKSVAVLKELGPEIQWLQSYVTGDKLYCVYLAPDESLIREHAKRGGFPANRISAVRRLIDPSSAE